MRYLCQRCETVFSRPPRKGRSPLYCSARCRKAASRSRTPRLPAELTSQSRWTARDGKRPVQVSGAPASSTDPRTWAPFDQVKHRPHGVMLGGGIACLDLDDCLVDGSLKSWARDAVAQIDPADVIWSEVSMSGKGVHVFHRSPEAAGRKQRMPDGGIEWYSRARFIAVTGDRFIDR